VAGEAVAVVAVVGDLGGRGVGELQVADEHGVDVLDPDAGDRGAVPGSEADLAERVHLLCGVDRRQVDRAAAVVRSS
jgi:hypothetical protein